jgi:AraC-like DNA-binding protein
VTSGSGDAVATSAKLERMYRERTSRIAGAVVWTREAVPGESRVLPDGCMDLMWVGDDLVVAGPDTGAFLAPGGVARTGLRFFPATAPAVLGVPADRLRDARVPLADLWTTGTARAARDLVARHERRGEGLEVLAARRLDAAEPDRALAAAVPALAAGRDITAIAAALGITARQLHRRSLAAFGYGPKLLARVLRMHRALHLTRNGLPPAAAAADAGYADQSHLARDVKALAGVPLGALTD